MRAGRCEWSGSRKAAAGILPPPVSPALRADPWRCPSARRSSRAPAPRAGRAQRRPPAPSAVAISPSSPGIGHSLTRLRGPLRLFYASRVPGVPDMTSPSTRIQLLLASSLLAGSAAAADPQVALTVYSSTQPGGIPAEWSRPLSGMGTPQASALPGFALVRVDREIELVRGRGTVQFSDVAALIDPTTVQFRSLTDPSGTKVLDQNFQFDLVSTDKLLSRYVDRKVSVESEQGDGVAVTEGTLLSAHDGLVLRGSDVQIHALRNWSGMRFGELPGGLITRPTLEWDVLSAKGGTHLARVSYQTGGITWWADYNLIFSQGADANSGFRSGTTRPLASACRCRPGASASRSRTRRTGVSSSSARTRSTTRRRTR